MLIYEGIRSKEKTLKNKRKGGGNKVENLEPLGAVHTHTHTHTSILPLNNEQGLEVALFVVASVNSKVNSNEEDEYVTLENSCEKNKCLKIRVLKNRLCF